MTNAKEIRTKIASVRSTQKITKAMEMVATSKMRKTQEQMCASRPYAELIRNVIGHLALVQGGIKHPYLETRDVKRVGYVIMTSDRGLCGGLNINLFKQVLTEMQVWRDKGVESELAVIGARGVLFFDQLRANVVAKAFGLGDNPTIADLIGTVKVMLDKYEKREIDRLFIVNNKFINTMTQKPQIQELLPLPSSTDEGLKNKLWDYIYEPEVSSLLHQTLKRYIESQVYQAAVENLASEQAARMVAMKAATDNGSNLVNDLQIIYNKARQSAITNELIDIVSGASAVSD